MVRGPCRYNHGTGDGAAEWFRDMNKPILSCSQGDNKNMVDFEQLPMRVGLGQFQEISSERLKFIKQCGCDDFQMNTPKFPGADRWEYEDIAKAVQAADDAGLRLMAVENVPASFYDKIMLGQPGRDKQLDNMVYTIRNLGRAGVPTLGYNFMPAGVWRTANDTSVRPRRGAGHFV